MEWRELCSCWKIHSPNWNHIPYDQVSSSILTKSVNCSLLFCVFFLRTLYWRISILPPASCVIMLITIISQFEDDGCYEIHRNKPLTCTQTNNRLDNINLWPSIIHAHTRKRYSKHTFNSYSYRKIPHFDTWWASLVYLLLLHIWNYRMAPTPKRTVFFFLFFFFSDNNAQ